MTKRRDPRSTWDDADLGFLSSWVWCWRKHGTPSQSAYNAAMEIIEEAMERETQAATKKESAQLVEQSSAA